MTKAEWELRDRRDAVLSPQVGKLRDGIAWTQEINALIAAAKEVGAEEKDREWLDCVGEVARDMGWVLGKRGWRKIGRGDDVA